MQKLRKSSIVFKKLGVLAEKLKTLMSSNYHRIFFAKILHAFPTYQNLQNGYSLVLFIFKLTETRFFTFLLKNQNPKKKKKKKIETLLQTLK